MTLLATARLTLRPPTEADREAVVKVFADSEMSRYFAADFSDPAVASHWVIERDGEVVGVAYLRPSWELPGEVPELGFYVASAHAGQDLATEAARALLDHGLGTLGLPAVWALVPERNAASRKVAERLGFLDVGSGVHYGDPHRVLVALPPVHGRPHHIELWVPDLAEASRSWGWLLGELGWREFQRWPAGVSWRLGGTYLVVEESPALSAAGHERTRPGLNHLALHVGTRADVDDLVARAGDHGWRPLFAEKYPHAGGPAHYAAYLENEAGFEIELVAAEGPAAGE
ncbi:GNAT family N-acetyltransferase [Amycolatopsis plumensis]|uniref:GNAT family N-acetyltransferase n=1 Tax=Amycolatopsis plumensis TaxID=236508 RepID=A0ABV5U0N6_9PSEU